MRSQKGLRIVVGEPRCQVVRVGLKTRFPDGPAQRNKQRDLVGDSAQLLELARCLRLGENQTQHASRRFDPASNCPGRGPG